MIGYDNKIGGKMTVKEKVQKLLHDNPMTEDHHNIAYLTYLNKYHGLAGKMVSSKTTWDAYMVLEETIKDSTIPSVETIARTIRKLRDE